MLTILLNVGAYGFLTVVGVILGQNVYDHAKARCTQSEALLAGLLAFAVFATVVWWIGR